MLTRGSKVANKLSRGKIPAKAFCFTAGTPVLVQGGTLPIERVAVGDLVLSRDAVTGEQALKRVTEIFVNTTAELVHLKVGDETISTTPKHPFWVEGSGWVDAGEVSAGDKLVLADGERATIVSVTREKLESPLDVYNFEVADFHTYFVASAGVWVHNACQSSATNKSIARRVVYKTRVSGTKVAGHRRAGNKRLLNKLESDADFARDMNSRFGYDVARHMRSGKSGLRNPRGMQWHHADDGRLHLKPAASHRMLHRLRGRKGPVSRNLTAGTWTP